MSENKSFGDLFKKYRLRAEIATFSELGEALLQKGLVYEDSIFSLLPRSPLLP